MFDPRLLNLVYAMPIMGGLSELGKAPIESTGYVGCALVTVGAVLIIGNEVTRVMDKARDVSIRAGYPTIEDQLRAAREPKPEPAPAPFEGLRPIIKVDGKPRVAYAYTARAV